MSDIRRTMKNNALAEVEDLDVLLFEGEVRAHRFVISPTSCVSFAGGSVVAKFVNAHQQMVQMDGAVDGTDATVTLGASCYTDPGEFKLTIFLIQGDMTAAIYACRGTVIATSGSEKTGDTEPIVEPGDTSVVEKKVSDMMQMLLAVGRLSNLWTEDLTHVAVADGEITVGGLTIKRTSGVIELNGTASVGSDKCIYVPLSHGELTSQITDYTDAAIQQCHYDYTWNAAQEYYDAQVGNVRSGRLMRIYLSGTSDYPRRGFLCSAMYSETDYDWMHLSELTDIYSETRDFMGYDHSAPRMLFMLLRDGASFEHYRFLPTIQWGELVSST